MDMTLKQGKPLCMERHPDHDNYACCLDKGHVEPHYAPCPEHGNVNCGHDKAWEQR